jgi:hypothetical protein
MDAYALHLFLVAKTRVSVVKGMRGKIVGWQVRGLWVNRGRTIIDGTVPGGQLRRGMPGIMGMGEAKID